VKLAAESFRENPNLDTAECITNMKTGTALVSVLDADGAPTIVEKTKILPPRSSMDKAEDELVLRTVEHDSIYGKYEKTQDPDSAYEEIDDIVKEEEEAKIKAKEEAQKAKEEQKEKERKEKEKNQWGKHITRKVTNRIENEIVNTGVKSAKKFLKSFFK